MQGNAKNLYHEIKDIINKHSFIGDENIGVGISCYTINVAKEYIRPDSITYEELISGRIHNNWFVDETVRKYMTKELWESLRPLVNYTALSDLYSVVLFINREINIYRILPKEINQILCDMLNIRENDNICHINSDIAGFIDDNLKETAGHTIFQIEADKNVRLIQSIIADMAKLNLKFAADEVFGLSEEYIGKFDKIIVKMPYFKPLRTDKYIENIYRIKEALYRKGIRRVNISGLGYLLFIIDFLSDNGKMVAIIPNGHLINSSDREVRQYLIENKKVEKVITLPANLLSYTNVSMNILVISHNNTHVRMVDASQYFTAGRRQNILSSENMQTILDAVHGMDNYKDVSIEDIISNDYSFLPKRYIEEVPVFENEVEFGKIIREIKRGVHIPASRLDELLSKEETDYQYLSMANFYNINQDLPYLKNVDNSIERYSLYKNDIIISKNGAPVKVGIVPDMKNNKHIIANGNVYIIRLNEELANPYYIKAFFDSEIGMQLFAGITAGSVIPTISLDSLKSLKIPLPPITEQNKIADGYKKITEEINELQNNIKEKEKQLSSFIADKIKHYSE